MTIPGTKQYDYHLVSVLRDLPIEITSVIFAENYQHADRLFYWKILTEFTPKEYAQILLNSTLDKCDVKDVSDVSNCNPGILIFNAVFYGQKMRSFLFPNDARGNLHVSEIKEKDPPSRDFPAYVTFWMIVGLYVAMFAAVMLLILI
jgi:hypothetical protein